MRLFSLPTTPIAGACWLILLCRGIDVASAQESAVLIEARHRMVREEVEGAGVTNPRVCDAMRKTPRHRFVSRTQRTKAYYDMALPIGSGQTISPPFIVAMMTQALDPQPQDRVLEIGTGSGYQAAVLSHLVSQVYSIEIVPALGRNAARVLEELEYKNVHTKVGDGFQGWAEHAPFNKIIVTCSPEQIPKPLVDQLAEGGMIVIPLGERYQQILYRFRKVGGELKTEVLEPTFFVPMTGAAEDLRRDVDDSGAPKLINGNFEAADDEGQPLVWYYVRQGRVVSESGSAGDNHFLQFSNATAGRGAHALQAVGIDGRKFRKIHVSLRVRTDQVDAGQSPKELPCLAVNFYDEGRARIRTEVMGPWTGTMPWTEHEQEVAVPGRCRLAVLGIGMFGAVGRFSVDDMKVQVVNE